MDMIKRFCDQPVAGGGGVVRTLSIDLGTTNSTIAESVWMPGYAPMCRVFEVVQPLSTGTFSSEMVPSVAVVMKDETIYIGEGARRKWHSVDRVHLVRGRNIFYETKNDMGLNKTYVGAPAYLDHAHKVAGYILAFLVDAAEQAAVAPYQAVTVTVPASFQMNQRRDTLRAGRLADLHLDQGSLLEEPTAALVDYLMSEESNLVLSPEDENIGVIFDFGGGTCDVSVVSITSDGENRPLSLSELSVSRYHRLGGGDIDEAIVHDVLIPALMESNGLEPADLNWEDKKLVLETQLIGTAETLKISLCDKIRERKARGTYKTDSQTMRATVASIRCDLNGDELYLNEPGLSIQQFETLLEPFLDTDHLYARETEYRMSQSVFSPLEDALDRAGIRPDMVDFCLITGGSVLIPQVREAIEEYFEDCYICCFEDPIRMQTAVARGAAWNTIYKTITGRPLIRPVLHDGIDLETNDGTRYPLVEPGTPLPWPADGSWVDLEMTVPNTAQLLVNQLRIKLMSHTDSRHLLNEIWDLPEAATAGDEIVMQYRVTAGKQFECRAFLGEAEEDEENEGFVRTLENPLVNVVNPGSIRLKIEEMEEKLRAQQGGNEESVEDYTKLARWYAELNHQEKALYYLRTALRKKGEPSAYISNLMGIYYKEINDYERAEKAYRESIRVADRGFRAIPSFNLAQLYQKTKRDEEALVLVDAALDIEREKSAYLSLKAEILNDTGQTKQARDTAEKAANGFPPLKQQEDWELFWYASNARFLGNDKAVADVETERKRRKQAKTEEPVDDETPRPVVRGSLVPFARTSAA